MGMSLTLQRFNVPLSVFFFVWKHATVRQLFSLVTLLRHILNLRHVSHVLFMLSPLVLRTPSDLLIRLDRPLYGVPEAGSHWYNMYHNHHMTCLRMKAARHDPCLLYTMQLFSENSWIQGTWCNLSSDRRHTYSMQRTFFKSRAK